MFLKIDEFRSLIWNSTIVSFTNTQWIPADKQQIVSQTTMATTTEDAWIYMWFTESRASNKKTTTTETRNQFDLIHYQ